MASPKAATATTAQAARHDPPLRRARPVARAPAAAPELNRAWKRTRRPGRSASAAVAAMFITTSTAPPVANIPTRATPNSGPRPAAAPPARSAAQPNSDQDMTGAVPQRSAREAVTALAAAAPAMATDSTSPKAPCETWSAFSTSAAATAHEPQKNPNTTKLMATGRRGFAPRSAATSRHYR